MSDWLLYGLMVFNIIGWGLIALAEWDYRRRKVTRL